MLLLVVVSLIGWGEWIISAPGDGAGAGVERRQSCFTAVPYPKKAKLLKKGQKKNTISYGKKRVSLVSF